jgi:NAD(P)-dependent dehydrogenase (short-subunit alcohol dehydrogenase family)
MESFAGRLGVVTGGGTGMGRELVVQLAAEGCSVALCDVNEDTMAEAAQLALKGAPDGTKVTTHLCDVADEAQVQAFAAAVVDQHGRDHVNLVFNNAGVGGGGSFLTGPREEWDRTFAICWGGVYNVARAFAPLLVASDAGHLVNTSSVNGFWAALGPGIPHTAYSAAKFAVKGFTEALMEDFRLNAPHVGVSVVMPGHIGTDIINNSRKILARVEPGLDEAAAQVAAATQMRETMAIRGVPTDGMTDEQLLGMMEMFGDMFREGAPMSAAAAAAFIIASVKAGKWRILVGDDAVRLDEAVRSDPENVYGPNGISLGTITGAAGLGE